MKTAAVIVLAFVLGCAVKSDVILTDRMLRTYLIDPNAPGLRYPYKMCVKYGWFGKCKEEKYVDEKYDFTKPEVRKEFIDMNVVCKVKNKKLKP